MDLILIHPERILKREITSRNLSAANKLALALRAPLGRITQIINGKRGISAESALRFSRYFGNSARFWINLQARYDLEIKTRARKKPGHLYEVPAFNIDLIIF